TVVFTSARTGHYELYRRAANGTGGEEPLLIDSLDKTPTSFSPKAKQLLYHDSESYDLWILPEPLGRGKLKPYPFLRTSSTEVNGQFSPDGRWIAYQSDDSGRYEIFVTPFP